MTVRSACIPLFTVLLTATAAFAKDGDEEACAGLEVGDDCTRADGDPGVCQEDTSDPGVLTCDDDALGAGGGGDTDTSSSGGCRVAGVQGGAALSLLALGLLRRRARR
jgi:hypothetical protein